MITSGNYAARYFYPVEFDRARASQDHYTETLWKVKNPAVLRKPPCRPVPPVSRSHFPVPERKGLVRLPAKPVQTPIPTLIGLLGGILAADPAGRSCSWAADTNRVTALLQERFAADDPEHCRGSVALAVAEVLRLRAPLRIARRGPRPPHYTAGQPTTSYHKHLHRTRPVWLVI